MEDRRRHRCRPVDRRVQPPRHHWRPQQVQQGQGLRRQHCQPHQRLLRQARRQKRRREQKTTVTRPRMVPMRQGLLETMEETVRAETWVQGWQQGLAHAPERSRRPAHRRRAKIRQKRREIREKRALKKQERETRSRRRTTSCANVRIALQISTRPWTWTRRSCQRPVKVPAMKWRRKAPKNAAESLIEAEKPGAFFDGGVCANGVICAPAARWAPARSWPWPPTSRSAPGSAQKLRQERLRKCPSIKRKFLLLTRRRKSRFLRQNAIEFGTPSPLFERYNLPLQRDQQRPQQHVQQQQGVQQRPSPWTTPPDGLCSGTYAAAQGGAILRQPQGQGCRQRLDLERGLISIL